jgi:hypothetical protein
VIYCAKIWQVGEPIPPEGYTSNLPDTPSHWFEEPLLYAVELFALEVWGSHFKRKDLHVNVRGTDGVDRLYLVDITPITDCRVDVTLLSTVK